MGGGFLLHVSHVAEHRPAPGGVHVSSQADIRTVREHSEWMAVSKNSSLKSNLCHSNPQSKQEVDDGWKKAGILPSFKSQTETLPQQPVQPSE